MHERSIVRALLRQVHEVRTERGAQNVCLVRVSVGEFSGVEPELFRNAFDELVDGSLISGAQLELSVVPMEACCNACSHEFVVQNFRFQCPQCEDVSLNIIRGEGLVLESVTLEEHDDQQQSG